MSSLGLVNEELEYKSGKMTYEVAVVDCKAMEGGCLMILVLILATSHAGEAEEDDDIVSAQNKH